MKAILVPVGEMPREIEVDGLKDLQEAVGGYIEPCGWMFNNKPTVYVNEDGKFICAPNRAVYAETDGVRWDGSRIEKGDLLDIIFGDFVCIGFDPETGEDKDIAEDEARRVFERFGTAASIMSGYLAALAIGN